MANPRPKGHNGLGQLRIIGGEWGSRRLTFPDAPGLRPTPDRVRETLFNWLAAHIAGARVLDVFTGSGALYFEALSRGASMGLALDNSAPAIASLKQNLSMLGCTTGQVLHTDALRYLENQPAEQFDLVFLDPPFHQDFLSKALPLCAPLLADGGLVYAESGAPLPFEPEDGAEMPAWLAPWEAVRADKAGSVFYHLLKLRASPA